MDADDFPALGNLLGKDFLKKLDSEKKQEKTQETKFVQMATEVLEANGARLVSSKETPKGHSIEFGIKDSTYIATVVKDEGEGFAAGISIKEAGNVRNCFSLGLSGGFFSQVKGGGKSKYLEINPPSSVKHMLAFNEYGPALISASSLELQSAPPVFESKPWDILQVDLKTKDIIAKSPSGKPLVWIEQCDVLFGPAKALLGSLAKGTYNVIDLAAKDSRDSKSSKDGAKSYLFSTPDGAQSLRISATAKKGGGYQTDVYLNKILPPTPKKDNPQGYAFDGNGLLRGKGNRICSPYTTSKEEFERLKPILPDLVVTCTAGYYSFFEREKSDEFKTTLVDMGLDPSDLKIFETTDQKECSRVPWMDGKLDQQFNYLACFASVLLTELSEGFASFEFSPIGTDLATDENQMRITKKGDSESIFFDADFENRNPQVSVNRVADGSIKSIIIRVDSKEKVIKRSSEAEYHAFSIENGKLKYISGQQA